MKPLRFEQRSHPNYDGNHPNLSCRGTTRLLDHAKGNIRRNDSICCFLDPNRGHVVLWTLWPRHGTAVTAGAAAPDIAGEHWINSMPLTIVGLRGRVVLVEFWTYG